MSLQNPAALAAAAIYLIYPAHADTPKFGTEVVLEVVSTLTLNTNQRTEFEKFSENPRYFGAMYINPFGSQSFRVNDFSSLKAARETAENRCNTDSLPSKCQIYAVSIPTGQDPNAEDIVSFSYSATKDFNEDYLEQQREGRFGAFAMSKGLSYGYTWDWYSQEEAEASAFLFCRSDVLKDMAKVYIDEREFSEKAGYNDCKVVHSYSSN